ncbi:MAG TPA: hypothetical protein VFM46_18385 [Pseudomonadales bacterium]|nr:hypothetical protein [Pseudomonadales bacterium]
MRNDVDVLILNPPSQTMGGSIPDDYVAPLALCNLGRLLVQAGFRVEILDAARAPMSWSEIVRQVKTIKPNIMVVWDYSLASTPASTSPLCRMLKLVMPGLIIVHGSRVSGVSGKRRMAVEAGRRPWRNRQPAGSASVG